MFEKFLEELGLSDKESKVYLALLEVENDSVIDLSKKTDINRTTIYPVLESLSKKGLISEIKVDKKVRYAAESPERLETYVERRKIQLEEQERKLKDIIPQLKSVQRDKGEKPIIKFYDGKEGIMSAIKEYFGPSPKGGNAYFLYDYDLVNEIFTPQEIKTAQNNRNQAKINAFSFYASKNESLSNSESSSRIKVDGDKYPIYCDIGVYDDYVRIHTLNKKVSAIYIKNKDIAETFKSLFRIAFDNYKKNN